MSHIIDIEPSCHGKAVGQQVWQDVMTEKYQSIMKNDVWDIVLRPEGNSVVPSKWIYKIKHVDDGSVEKYKARFVARGFSHVEGIYYEETFVLRFGYLGKWSPCVCEPLNISGKHFVPCTMYFMSNFTLT
jgi:hypothetical protein